MTIQIPELIIIDGEAHSLYAEPLHEIIHGYSSPVKLTWDTTACQRGYCGIWKIKESKIYLEMLYGQIKMADEKFGRYMDLLPLAFPDKENQFSPIGLVVI